MPGSLTDPLGAARVVVHMLDKAAAFGLEISCSSQFDEFIELRREKRDGAVSPMFDPAIARNFSIVSGLYTTKPGCISIATFTPWSAANFARAMYRVFVLTWRPPFRHHRLLDSPSLSDSAARKDPRA